MTVEVTVAVAVEVTVAVTPVEVAMGVAIEVAVACNRILQRNNVDCVYGILICIAHYIVFKM